MKSEGKSESYSVLDDTCPCGPLGPYPVTTVAVLVDLGMTDQEIAGYFRVRPDHIAQIRQGNVQDLQFVCDGKRGTRFDLDRG